MLIYRRLLSKVTLNSHFIIISCDVFIMKDLRSRQRYRKKSFTVKDQIREYPIKMRIEEYYNAIIQGENSNILETISNNIDLIASKYNKLARII